MAHMRRGSRRKAPAPLAVGQVSGVNQGREPRRIHLGKRRSHHRDLSRNPSSSPFLRSFISPRLTERTSQRLDAHRRRRTDSELGNKTSEDTPPPPASVIAVSPAKISHTTAHQKPLRSRRTRESLNSAPSPSPPPPSTSRPESPASSTASNPFADRKPSRPDTPTLHRYPPDEDPMAGYGTTEATTAGVRATTGVVPGESLHGSQSSLVGETYDTAPLLNGRPAGSNEDTASGSGISIEEGVHHRGNSVSEAVYHIICVIAGSGVLQLPYALNQSGWVGVLIILFSAWANQYSGMLLVKCLYANGSERLKGFPHVGKKAFGKRGKILVEVLNSVMLLGVPIVYLILSGMNFEILFGYFDTRGWIIFSAALVTIPFLIYKTLKEIAILSAFGVFATIVVIVTVLSYAIIDIPKNSGKVTHKLIDFARFPSALGSISFSYAGNFVYPEVESSMADPSKFPLVLTLSMTIISAMYLSTAVLGYAAYGSTTVSPILNNLPEGPIAKFAIAVITLHVLFAIPVLITTFSLEMERRLGIGKDAAGGKAAEGTLRTLLRLAIVFGITGLAMAVPFFADFMTLLGAIANTNTANAFRENQNLIFVFPVLFDFALFGFRARPLREKAIGILILMVGIYGGVIGGWEAIRALILDFQGKGSGGRGGH
ncbi:hypothetical protein HDU96_007803 [Phlyctochytrium bullatum]|nr:hypothetical protein HDU96_007803 [Phlyctochytrium bullatum]